MAETASFVGGQCEWAIDDGGAIFWHLASRALNKIGMIARAPGLCLAEDVEDALQTTLQRRMSGLHCLHQRHSRLVGLKRWTVEPAQSRNFDGAAEMVNRPAHIVKDLQPAGVRHEITRAPGRIFATKAGSHQATG